MDTLVFFIIIVALALIIGVTLGGEDTPDNESVDQACDRLCGSNHCDTNGCSKRKRWPVDIHAPTHAASTDLGLCNIAYQQEHRLRLSCEEALTYQQEQYSVLLKALTHARHLAGLSASGLEVEGPVYVYYVGIDKPDGSQETRAIVATKERAIELCEDMNHFWCRIPLNKDLGYAKIEFEGRGIDYDWPSDKPSIEGPILSPTTSQRPDTSDDGC